MTTFSFARINARKIGYTIRKTVDSEMVVYPVGTGADHPAAYFTDCPADALDTARAMAANDGPKVTVSTTPAPAHGCMGLPETPVAPRPVRATAPTRIETKVTVSTIPAPAPGCMGTPAGRQVRFRSAKVTVLNPAKRTRADLERMAARSDVLGELARDGLAAVASGGFPLYAFNTGRRINADELDAMAYGYGAES